MKVRKRLEFIKAGKEYDVEVFGNEKSIDKLCRNLERDTGVWAHKITDIKEEGK